MAYAVRRKSGRWTGYFRHPTGRRLSAGTFASQDEALRRAQLAESEPIAAGGRASVQLPYR